AIRKLQRFVTRGSQEKGALSIEVVNIDNRKNKTNANLKEVHGNQRKSHLIRGFPDRDPAQTRGPPRDKRFKVDERY
ncbi:MAG TPA: hypothetical protein PKO39_05735, partial [Bacilli bacterium]|nr:hypothetical protein [Bacilli bacterium]HQC90017.1 hypothetical protein [Bacilli bacterium]